MEIDFNVSVVLPASGNGERFGSIPPKQFAVILDQPLIVYSIVNFHSLHWINEIIVVVNKKFIEKINQFIRQNNLTKVKVVEGCHTRHRSIYAGIKAVKKDEEDDVIIIQDGVRLFADEDLIRQVALAARKHGAAGVTRSLVSTVIAGDSENFLKESLNRSLYRASEMPQGFKYDVIKAAYEKATDDDFDYGTECLLLAMKYADTRAMLLDGPDNLWKVTYRKDFYAAEAMLKESYLRASVIIDKGCESKFQDVCDRVKVLCKERRITVEPLGEEEKSLTKCNSYVVLKDKFTTADLLDNFTSTTGQPGIQIPPCVIYVFNGADTDFSLMTSVFHETVKTINDRIYFGIVFEVGGDIERLAVMIVDLLWNRTKSLSGQVFRAT